MKSKSNNNILIFCWKTCFVIGGLLNKSSQIVFASKTKDLLSRGRSEGSYKFRKLLLYKLYYALIIISRERCSYNFNFKKMCQRNSIVKNFLFYDIFYPVLFKTFKKSNFTHFINLLAGFRTFSGRLKKKNVYLK